MTTEIILPKKNGDLNNDSKQILASFFANISSPLTAREYKYAVKDFLSFLGGDISHPKELKRYHIVFYRNYLKDSGLFPNTIQKKMSAVSSFCKFLAEDGLVDKDITYGVRRPRTENKLETSDLTDEEVKKIFNALDPKKYNYFFYRAILAVGFYTGLRSQEIRHLRIKNIGDVDGIKILHLKIKGDKTHEIPLHPFVLKAIYEHLEKLSVYGIDTTNPEQVLFPSMKHRTNKPMTAVGLYYIFKGCLKKAGISKNDFRRYSPHSMRATFASHLLNTKEEPLEDVQKALGHASPTTTQKYNKRKKGHHESLVYRIDY